MKKWFDSPVFDVSMTIIGIIFSIKHLWAGEWVWATAWILLTLARLVVIYLNHRKKKDKK